MAVAAFESPLMAGLYGDAEIAAHFSAEAEIAAMLRFEAALARVEARLGVIPAAAGPAIAQALAGVGIAAADLDQVIFYDKPGVKFSRLVETSEHDGGDRQGFVSLASESLGEPEGVGQPGVRIDRRPVPGREGQQGDGRRDEHRQDADGQTGRDGDVGCVVEGQ